MAFPEHGRYNLIAAFVDLDAAQRAIEQLKRQGVRGDNVSLLGRSGREIVAADTHTADRDSIPAAIKGTVAGSVGGGLLGGLTGFLVGLTTLAIPGVGPVITAGVWAAAAGGFILGAEGGGFIGAIAATELSKGRAEAYESFLTQGHALIGVHGDNAEQLQQAYEALVREQPLAIDRFGAGYGQEAQAPHA